MSCLELQERGANLVRSERPVPAVNPTDVLVSVEATGVGQSVYNKLYRSDRITEDNLPLIPGHELVGTVVETGDAVTHVAPGDLVTPHYYHLCGSCKACVSEREQWCENLTGQIGVEHDGGYAEYALIPGASTIKLPDRLDPSDATVVADAVGTPYHVCRQRAEIEPGHRVMVLGAGGGVGIHLVQMAVLLGAEVTAVDRSSEKLRMCNSVGAKQTIDTRDQSIIEATKDRNVRYDVIADFTGSSEIVASAINTLERHGRFINLTTVMNEPLVIDPAVLVEKEIDVVGSRYCSRYELIQAAELVASGAIEPIITETVGFDGVGDLLNRIVNGEIIGRGVMRP